jgi:hypothetical protein
MHSKWYRFSLFDDIFDKYLTDKIVVDDLLYPFLMTQLNQVSSNLSNIIYGYEQSSNQEIALYLYFEDQKD